MTSRVPSAAHVRWGLWLQRLPSWLVMLLIAGLTVGAWALVYVAGGTKTAFPHLFYVPILVAAVPFGAVGGVAAGALAMVFCGPLMPLDVVAAEPQEVANWLTRGGFFVSVGAWSGATLTALRGRFEADLADQLLEELELASSPQEGEPDGVWAARVAQALEDSAFRIVFQPIYTLADGRLTAVEALTRFDGEPSYPPDVWFKEAHRAGLGTDLELATLDAALQASVQLDGGVAVSFNASPRLITDHRLLQLLDRHAGRRLVAEVTEHAAIDDYREIAEALSKLRARGLEVAVDDAGAGFASLRHIVRLDPDVIKLDPSLTQNLGHDPVRRPLADALLQFAGRTGSRVVVEGIESPSDLNSWRELGAHAAQGYLLARPGPLPFPLYYGSLTGWRQPAARERTSEVGV